jgi:galactose-1-phosphate uridylyltransferase
MVMIQNPYVVMRDGTIKQVNPFTGTEVWFIPGRGNKPDPNARPRAAQRIDRLTQEDHCTFCESGYMNTPPEKSRLIRHPDGRYEYLNQVSPSELNKTVPLFRRISNLFEIVSTDYWKKNYDYVLSEKNIEWKNRYLSESAGVHHVLQVLHLKLRLSKMTEKQIEQMPIEEKFRMADAFFGGCHELLIGGRHYREKAEYDSDLWFSGDMTPEEHFHFFRFTIKAAQDIYENNRYVRYISIFQNWLAPAGASFNHIHKQLVALDEWGISVQREVELVRQNPNIYNEYAANFASYHNFVFAENDHAIAFVSIGHRSPTLAIYSKSNNCRPEEHSDEELRGFSDLVHACHAAMGSAIPCNEEWYYLPKDSVERIPWHILIKWRTNTPAGFEGGTKIYTNTLSPTDMRDIMVPQLYKYRAEARINVKHIATECPAKANSLKYYMR